MDNVVDIGSLQGGVPAMPLKGNLLLVAPRNFLVDALQVVLMQSGSFNWIGYNSTPDYGNCSELAKFPQLTVCVFLDLDKDLEKLRMCRTLSPAHSRIIAVCADDANVNFLKRAITEGAHGLISMSSTLDELMLAIKRTSQGENVLSKQMGDILMDHILDEYTFNQPLTKREQQVLEMVCNGQTIKEIAYSLKLSPHTVQYYHRSVMEKVGVNRTADLIVYAMRSGLYSSCVAHK